MIVVFLVAVCIPIGVNMATDSGNYDVATEKFTRKAVPQVLTVSQDPAAAVVVVNNGTVTLPASNYSDFLSINRTVVMKDNSSKHGVYVYVTYQYGYRLTGIYYLLFSILAVAMVVFGLYMVLGKSGMSGRK